MTRLHDITARGGRTRAGALSSAAALGLGLIAASLPLRANAPTSVPPAEKAYQQADPVLYAAARQYFPSDETAAPKKRIFRLTCDQIDATVAALLPGTGLPSVKEVMPKDALQTNYEYADILSFNAANVGSLAGWIGTVAAKVRENPATAIDCAASSNAPECLAEQTRKLVVRAFRGDVTPERVDKIMAFYLDGVKRTGFAQATGDLVEVLLNSPSFLFRKELDTNKNARLSPTQLLQAVSYTIADVPPETLGLESARADSYLRTGAEAGATIRSIVASRPARDKLQRFFTAWLEVREPADFAISAQTFPEFTPAMAAAMHEETQRFLRAQLSKDRPRLKDITQATQAVVSKPVASLYGAKTIAPPSGSGWVNVDTAQRLGIFSQPAVIASHSGPTNSRPIKRGVFWVRKVMCMEMEPPPADVHAKLYEMTGTTERQRIESVTGAPNCAGCHKVINPFSFFQESYDALGRWRTQDNGAPIDTSILINFLDEEPVKTQSTVDALKTLTDSMMFKQCFVRQLFRFYMGRQEEASDEPLLRRLFFELGHDDSQDLLRAVWTLTTSDRIVRRQ